MAVDVNVAPGQVDGSVAAFAVHGGTLDNALADQNADYRAIRRGNIVLGPPEVIVAPADTFTAWMVTRGQLGGQHKVKRVVDESTLKAMSADR